VLSEQSFDAVVGLFRDVSGIQLGAAKRALVTGRLQKLAHETGSANVDAFVQDLLRERDPRQITRVVDKLTTNETYFFREPQHFDFLAATLAARGRGDRPLRVWSAASSTGEEAYSIAMVLEDKLGGAAWEVIGTDLSTTVVEQARQGLFPMDRARQMPPAYLKRYCRKGLGDYEGTLLVARELRERVRFEAANLMQPLPDIGRFDLIFLRNVLIYFDTAGKQAIVRRVLSLLAPDGFLLTGHAESLSNLGLPIRTVQPAVYGHA
jgi:chemotaxis protein methyltransferase CheR